MTRQVRIVPTRTAEEVEAFRVLAREYAASLDFALDYQGFDAEMASLPGKYAWPGGELLLAVDAAGAGGPRAAGGEVVGIIAVRALDESGYRAGDARPACEMKRMYVKPTCRGWGVGRLLGEASMEAARRAGYRMMKLDTEESFAAAMGLYQSLGFERCERYNDDPMPETVYFRRWL
jgi:GNAT superfamily N-acetyltransferase